MDDAMEGSVSGLSSLEHDADADDFDLRILQTARDERRLKQALHSRVHVFGKARTHPRVGLTMANLERSNANAHDHAHAYALHRPLSRSSISASTDGSSPGDPAMHAPSSWGRKSRAKRDWIRSIACDPETASPNTASPPAMVLAPEREPDASADWDLTFELNEASMIASTPYIPRSTTLDEIRQRETDSQHLLRRLARVSHTPPAARPSRPSDRQLESAHDKSEPEPMPKIESKLQQRPEPEREPEPEPEPEPKSEPRPRPESDPEQIIPLPETTPHPDTTTPHDNKLSHDIKSPDILSPLKKPPETPLPPKTPVVTGAWLDTPALRSVPPSTIPSRPRPSSPTQSSPHKRRSSTPASRPSTIVPPLSVLRPSLPTSALQAVVFQAKSSDRRPSAEYGDSTLNSLQDLITDAPDAALEEDTLHGLQLPTVAPQNEAQRQRHQELLHLHRMNDRLRAARTSIRDASRGMKRVEDQVDQVDHIEQDTQGKTGQLFRRGCPCASTDGHEISFWRWVKSLVWQKRLQTLRQASNSKWRAWGGLTGLGIALTLFLAWWISEEIACEIYCHHAYAWSSPHPFSVNMNAPQYPFVLPTLFYRNFIRFWWLPIWSCLRWIYSSIWGLAGSVESEKATLVASALREMKGSIWSTATVTAPTMTMGSWVSGTHGEIVEDMGRDLGMMDDEPV